MNAGIAARLADCGIQLAAEAKGQCLFVRGDLLAIAVRAGEGFGSIGSTGIMTERGLAYLVCREGGSVLASKGGETPADERQVEAVRKFSEDLKAALEP